MRQVDLLAPGRRIVFRQKRLEDARGDEIRIGKVRGAIGKRDPLRFDEQMEIVRRSRPHRFHVVALEDVQHLEHHEPLRVRRHLVDVVAPVARRDWIDPVRAMVGEVARVEQAVASPHVRRDGSGDRSLVEGVAPSGGDLLQRGRKMRIRKDLARTRGMAVRQEGRSGR